MTRPLTLQAAGLCTPAPGDRAEQVAALLAGRPLFRRHPRWIGADGQRQIMGQVPDLEAVRDYPTRCALLLHRAYQDCLGDQRARGIDPAPCPLVVLLPPQLRPDAMRSAFRAAAAQLDFGGVTDVRPVFGDAAAVVPVLDMLRDDGPAGPAHVAAVDCLVAPFMLDYLAASGLARDRLARWNPIPAEASACLLLSTGQGPTRLLNWAGTREPQDLRNPGRGLLGRGLRHAIDAVTSGLDGPLAQVVVDGGPERWRAEEMGVIASEFAHLAGEVPWFHLSRSAGDFGAASAVTALAVAARLPGSSLVLASTRSGGRAAAIVTTD